MTTRKPGKQGPIVGAIGLGVDPATPTEDTVGEMADLVRAAAGPRYPVAAMASVNR